MSENAVAVDAERPDTGAELRLPAGGGRKPAGGRVRQWGRRAARSCWLWPTAFAALVVTWHIGRPEMWHDELVTVNVTTRTTGQIIDMIKNVDAVHGTYYLFVHFWVGVFGDSPTAVRTPSALAMTAATACVALAGNRLFGRAAGIAAGFVFAVVPTVTRFGQEGRSYAFVVLGAALATLLLLRALERPGVLRWAGYTLSVAAIGAVNVVALTLLLGHAVGVLIRWWRVRGAGLLVQYALSASLGVLLAVPVILTGMQQAKRQLGWIPPAQPWPVWVQAYGSPLIAGAVTALAVLGLLLHRRSPVATTATAATAAAVAVLPLPVILLASTGEINYFFSKYLLFLIPAWAVLAGAGAAALRRPPLIVAALVLLAGLAVPGQLALRAEFSHGWYTYPQARAFEPLSYSGAARIIAADYRPGDAMVAGNPWWWMHDPGVRYYLPTQVRLRNVFQARTAAQRSELFGSDCPDPARCLRDEPRIWVVLPTVTGDPLAGLPAKQSAALAAHYRVARVEHPRGLTVALLERRG